MLVTLSFDYSEYSLSKGDIDDIGTKYGVLIQLRDKNKQASKCISIKGKEKFIGECRCQIFATKTCNLHNNNNDNDVFISDKIYQARHELLKLNTPLIKAGIPSNYYSKTDLTDEFAYRQTLALPNPNRSESPLHFGQNFVSQLEAIQNALTPNMARIHNLQNNRQRVPQSNYHLSPHSNASPRHSLSPITSGYNSAHNSFNSSGSSSMDAQLNPFQQPQTPFLDRSSSLMPDANNLFDEEKTPTLLDVKVKDFNFNVLFGWTFF